MEEVIIGTEDINSEEAEELISELSGELKKITGNDGRGSFKKDDMDNKRSVFVIARDLRGNALGCGALRYYSDEVAEIKRMYVKKKSMGVGSRLLQFLEGQAKEYNYSKIVMETRVVNKGAVNFYKRNGYKVTENYGKYEGRTDAICFCKDI